MIHNGMSAADLTGWRKSSKSWDDVRTNCVEVTSLPGGVGMRNSRHPDGPALIFTRYEMRAFVHGVKDGEFDDLI
jgi:hypothetical protein